MDTIPDFSRRDPDIAARLASLRRIATFEAAEAEVDPAACARLMRWYDAATGEPIEAHQAQVDLDDETAARLAALRCDDDPFWLRAQLRRVDAARCLWQLAACWWFVCWLVAAGVALALVVR